MTKEKMMFGVTRMKNNKFMVQAIYPRQDTLVPQTFLGVFDDLAVANREYILKAPYNVQLR